jgi:hypothetical protein
MDKYLLLLGFQLTQAVALGAVDGSMFRLFAASGWHGVLAGATDPANFGVLFEALVSGTWIGRLADIGEFATLLVRGVGHLPLALIALQWGVLLGLLYAERQLLQRRLQRIAAAA